MATVETAPLALDSFSVTNSAPRLGYAAFSIDTKVDTHVTTVKIFRVASGAAFDPGTATLVNSVAVGSNGIYNYTDGDNTRTNAIPNSTFDSSTGYSLGTGLSVSSGVLNTTNTGAVKEANIVISTITNGKQVRGVYDLTLSSGDVRVRLRNTGAGTAQDQSAQTTSGQKLFALTLTADRDRAGFRFSETATGTVDNFYMYEASVSCAPQGNWDYYAIPYNTQGGAGPTSGPVAVTIA